MAEIHSAKIQGLAYRALGRPGLAEELLERASVIADWTGNNHLLVAEVHDLVGDISLTNKHWKKAEEAFGVSAERFAKASDSERSAQAREKAQKAKAKETKSPVVVAG